MTDVPRLGSDTFPARVAAAVSDTATMTGRHVRRLGRLPTLLALSTIQPVLFVVLFTAVFGGAIDAPGVDQYIDYLLPGLVVLSLVSERPRPGWPWRPTSARE